MRVLLAPDCFGGTLTAREAAQAMAEGWRSAAPADQLLLRPLSDGGPGFVDVLHTALGGQRHELVVTGPLGEPVTATWLEHEGTGYVESAQACGLHLTGGREPERADTRGVGELLAAVRAAGMHTAVIGLGGSGSTDGGAGMIAALGRQRPGLRLVAASDVQNPLLGPHGAAHVFGPQKGADPDAVRRLEARMTAWAGELAQLAGRDVRDLPGAGAAGGLGAGLLALGAELTSGAGLVRELTGLDAALDDCELAVTGEGSFDWQSLRGKLVTAVASGAAERGVPCLVLAGQVSVGRREMGAVGVEAAYAVAQHVGSVRAALDDPAGTLRGLAEHVAGQWSSTPRR